MHVEKRENAIVNRLNKTKVEKFPDLREEKEARLKELGKRDRDAQQARVRSFLLYAPAQPVPSLLSTFLLSLSLSSACLFRRSYLEQRHIGFSSRY